MFQIGLCSSVECKGIIGNDGRHYILDLLRTFPPDLNFLELSEIELSKEAKALGFPIVHKHKLCCLRQELIDAFVESRYMMFIKYAAVHLQQLGLKKQMNTPGFENQNGGENADKKADVPAIKDASKEDENKVAEAEADKPKMEEEEAKKIVESLTDSITSGKCLKMWKMVMS